MKHLRKSLERYKAEADAHAAKFEAEGRVALAAKFAGRADGLELALALLDGATRPTGLLAAAVSPDSGVVAGDDQLAGGVVAAVAWPPLEQQVAQQVRGAEAGGEVPQRTLGVPAAFAQLQQQVQ